ncbi:MULTISPECIES: plastocyanin/azurin family copper-binding protein [Halorussus]|uniref:plastocyanin/azurin family copper-binding protein n=1 Tax=Halorussus TaxID=1070314 RepID=UPI000E218528|nr:MULTISPECIES: plastocyanin/azurin family copper-binding protein [Halorussus]NHN57846.1 plastocyanin [Halorussus sp. JP-T4]
MTTRRKLLLASGTALATTLGGCSSTGGSGNGNSTAKPDADIAVGPQSSLVFDPDSLTVSVGDEVTWRFDSSGHNVSCNPAHSDRAQLPADADAFASYDGNNKYSADAVGSTFSHTFETPGTYVYVCVPHEMSGMVGEIEVTA